MATIPLQDVTNVRVVEAIGNDHFVVRPINWHDEATMTQLRNLAASKPKAPALKKKGK
jgi:hypothetical protein